MSRLVVSILALLIAAPMAFAEGNIESGKGKFQVCLACHGANGEGNAQIGAPRIGGQPAWYLQHQLRNLKAGIRGADPADTFGMQMRPMAMTLATDQDIEDVTSYITTLAPPVAAKTIEGDVAKGKELYAVCAACHGDDGKGIKELGTPIIAGQSDVYLQRQLDYFKDGKRGKHADDILGRPMSALSGILLKDDQAELDVLAYINTLQ